MQSADTRERNEMRRLARIGRNGSHRGCVFFKRVVGSVRVIIINIYGYPFDSTSTKG